MENLNIFFVAMKIAGFEHPFLSSFTSEKYLWFEVQAGNSRDNLWWCT